MDSAGRILDLGDDMVTEILLRLPLESTFRFRSVSKQWNSLLTSPEFLSHYSRRFHHRQPPHNLLGFFKYTFSLTPRMRFLSTQPGIGPEDFSSDLGSFITSSNGLVLSGTPDERSLYILNPVTRKHVSLPPPRKHPFELSFGLSCDEDGDDLTPRYQVVIADNNTWFVKNHLRIQTYSSETKEWRESILVATSYFSRIRPSPLKVVNGVFYWVVEPGFLGVYDPHNKYSNHLQLIQRPAGNHVYDYLNRYVLNQKPDGGLIFGQTSDGLIKIWELPKGFWRETTIGKQECDLIYTATCEDGLEPMEVITWDPLILMVRQGSRVFQYNMETKQMNHILSLSDELDEPFFGATSFSSYLLA